MTTVNGGRWGVRRQLRTGAEGAARQFDAAAMPALSTGPSFPASCAGE